jgi:hypothetical protein
MYKVRALETLFYDLRRYRTDDVFVIKDMIDFSKVSMEFVDDEDEEKYLEAFDGIVERKIAIKKATVEAPLDPVVMKKAKPAKPQPLHKAPSKKKSEVI